VDAQISRLRRGDSREQAWTTQKYDKKQ